MTMASSETPVSLNTNTTTSIPPEDAELISQLAKLQDMHQKLAHLRTLLPTALIGPARAALSQKSRSSPQSVAEAVAKAARQGSADIRDFQKDWHDEKTRQLFKEVNAADTPQGIDAWLADYEAMIKSGSATLSPSEVAKDVTFDTDEQARTDLEKEINDKTIPLELDAGSEIGKFPITLVLNGGMKFAINNDQAPRTYTIHSTTDGSLASRICRQLTKSGHSNSGEWKKIVDLVVSPKLILQ